MSGLKSFKGAMSKLYDERRAAVKGIKAQSLVNKARNEAKREMEEAQSDQPLHLLRLDGRAARLVRNDAVAYAQQHSPNEGLVPWAAHPEVLIDRYDVRSLLDLYVEPDPRVWRHRQRTAREVELEEQLHFETCRDLVRLKCLGLTERQGIKHAEQENVAIRAHARQAAVAELEAVKAPKPLPSQNAAFASGGAPAGTGSFAAVGYSYGGGGGGGGPEAGGGDECGGAGGSGGEEEEEEESDDEDLPFTAEDQDMDRLAVKEFGVEDFSSMLRWAMKEEAEAAAASRRRKRSGWGRKKARLRSKRLEGQGLDPSLYVKPTSGAQRAAAAAAAGGNDISWIPEMKPEDLAQMYAADRDRGSPTYDADGRRARSGSPSGATRRPGSQPKPQFITSFGVGPSMAPASAAAGAAAGNGEVYTAGGVGPPPWQRQQQQAQGASQGPQDALPGAKDPARDGPALLPAAAFKLHGVRPKERRERERERYGGSVSGRDYSRAKAAAAAAPTTVVRAVAPGKETPQERLKRLMAAQLNKKIQKDSLTEVQKQQQVEAELQARAANEVAMARAAERDRERARERERLAERRGRQRSRSPGEQRHRGGSRSRSRSGERRRGSSGGDGGGLEGRYQRYERGSRSRSRSRGGGDRQYRSSSRRSASPTQRHYGSGRR